MEFPSEPPRWRRYLRFWRRDVRADVDDEIAFHFQTRVDELTGSGLTLAAAREHAIAEFGDVRDVRRDLVAIGERMARRERLLERFDGWRQDLSYSIRSLRRTPGVTLTVIVTLALGLGANGAMFTLLNDVFLRPPDGVVHPGAVRRVWTEIAFRSGTQFWSGYDYPQYATVRDAVRSIGATTIYRPPDEMRIGPWGSASRAMVSSAASDYFALLGIRPALGRFYGADEDRLGGSGDVVVASHAYWERALGGDSAAIGRPLRIGGKTHTLVGVAARSFDGVDLDRTDLWIPMAAIDGIPGTPWWTDYRVNGFQILVRLQGGVPDAAVNERLTPVFRRTQMERGRDTSSVTRVGSIITARGPGKKAQEIQIATRLGGVAVVVLLIACANVVSLLLARAVRRRREIAMRLALGISRARLARLVLTESVLLAAVAGLAAVLAARAGGTVLRALLLPDVHWARSPLDWRVLVLALGTSVVAGFAAGLVPAVQSGAMSLTEVLKAGARDGYVGRSRLRSLLVIAQVALSVMLLVGAALFVKSLSNVRELDLGFDADRLLFARVRYESADARRDSLLAARLADAADRLRAAGGVQSVALTAMRPMYGFSTTPYYPDADTVAHRKPMGMYWAVSADYFATAGTRIVAGTTFAADERSATPPSVIINTAMAEALWPGESPLGRCVRFETVDGRCNTVVGVVETARWGALIEESTPQFYLPLANMPFPASARTLAVRVMPSMMPAVVREVRQVLVDRFPGAEPVVEPMATAMAPNYRPWRLGATLFSMFGVLALVVAALGVYSTMAYSVSQRTHEFGVRMALGARFRHVTGHVLGESLRLVALGLVAGVALALGAGRIVATLLYGVSPHDPATLILVAAGLLVVAATAAMIPAWRAARVDPLTALRAE